MNDIAAAKNMAERLRALDLPTATEAATLLEEQAEKLRFYAICMNTGGADDLRRQMRDMAVRIAELTAPRIAVLAAPPIPASSEIAAPADCSLMSECMGPLFGEPHCPCKMEKLGLPPSERHRQVSGITGGLLHALSPEYFPSLDSEDKS